jgi:hypothetical protein
MGIRRSQRGSLSHALCVCAGGGNGSIFASIRIGARPSTIAPVPYFLVQSRPFVFALKNTANDVAIVGLLGQRFRIPLTSRRVKKSPP